MSLFEQIISRTPIKKGWSGDHKFHVITCAGEQYLLRISPLDKTEHLYTSFERMKRLEQMGMPMCRPVEIGQCGEGVYVLHSWVDGQDAEDVIPKLSTRQQYEYGLEGGRILRKIHTLTAPETLAPWEVRFGQKLDLKLERYAQCPLKYDFGECFLEFIEQNRHLLADRPQTYQHGDYHSGNMMIDHNGVLTVIDFDRDDFGDPWHEFNRIVWSAQLAPMFATGLVDGYFDGCVPMEFWKLLALYICYNSISSLPWAVSYGEREIDVMRGQARQILSWYNNMSRIVPDWYGRSNDDIL